MFEKMLIMFSFSFSGITVITQQEYRDAVRHGRDIDWSCSICFFVDDSLGHSLPPQAESTRMELDLSAEFPPPRSPAEYAESSLEEPTLNEQPRITNQVPTYQVIEHSIKRGCQKLVVDSSGFTYNVQRRRRAVVDWQCTVRPKVNPCRATVIQRGAEDFRPGAHRHNHSAQVGADLAAKVTQRVKAMAVLDVFRPASAIVDEVSVIITF